MFDLSQAFNRFCASRLVALALVMFLHGSFTWAQETRTLAKPGEAIERMVRDVDAAIRLLARTMGEELGDRGRTFAADRAQEDCCW